MTTTLKPFYITTPIYYVNDRPHIGHCYTTTVADAVARMHRLIRGEGTPNAGGSPAPAHGSVYFLTGTDEHADKVVTSAAERGKTPQEWADINAAQFRAAFDAIECRYDDFIRTTEPRHKDKVPDYIKSLMATGDIYKGEYTGWYDAGQEEYVPENTARENNFISAINKKPLVKRTEPCYFFRLGKYQQALLDLITSNPRFVMPEARRQEVLGRLRPPAVLNDIPVSRPVTSDPATQWGIRIPGDAENRVYVWIDALFNYYTAVNDAARPDLAKFWPASVHLIGKDILWFHAVIWPALLLALKKPLPGTIFGHGWWISEGEKMSKSMGNFIDLEKLQAYAGKFSLDALRWYLLTQGPLSGTDADFSHAKFVEVYNADLANGIGNCASRVSNMIEKYFGGSLPDPRHTCTFENGGASPVSIALAAKKSVGKQAPGEDAKSFPFPQLCKEACDDYAVALDRVDLSTAFGCARLLVQQVDDFISHTAPFTLAKTLDANPDAKQALAAILYACAETVRVASLLFAPAMPTKMAALWRAWNCTPAAGVPLAELAAFAGAHALKPGHAISKGEALFMRADAAEAAPGAAPKA
jgi:methionyl-tRNA synthetase